MPDQLTEDTDVFVYRMNQLERTDATSMGTLVNSSVTSTLLQGLLGLASSTIRVSDILGYLSGRYQNQSMVSVTVTAGKSATVRGTFNA